MKLSRDLQRPMRYFIDQLLPPLVRDSQVLKQALKVIFKADSETVWEFRKNFPSMTDDEVRDVYSRLSKHALKVSTDINNRCLDKIKEEINKKRVLDAGCGTGKLAELKGYSKYVGGGLCRAQFMASS